MAGDGEQVENMFFGCCRVDLEIDDFDGFFVEGRLVVGLWNSLNQKVIFECFEGLWDFHSMRLW